MKFEILKCKLKPETRSGVFINGNRRYHDSAFEIKSPGAGVQKNVEVFCDVEVIEMTQPDEIETNLINEKEQDLELIQFAVDCWNLAVDLEEKVLELTPEDSEIVPEIKKRSRKTKK